MADFSETYRGDVEAWECDAFGHMNIAFYGERFGDGAASLLARLEPSWAFRTVSLFTRYTIELRAGESISIRSRVLGTADGAAKGEAVARVGHELLMGDGRISTVAEQALAPRDTKMRAELRKTLDEAGQEWREPPFKAVTIPAASGSFVSLRDRVKSWELDEVGQLSLLGHVRRFSTASSQLMNMLGMTGDYIHTAKRGFATFETRLALTEYQPGAGAELMATSGFISIGNSSVTMIQDLVDVKRGERIARYYQAGVHFDLERRRSAPLPDGLRAKAADFMVAKD